MWSRAIQMNSAYDLLSTLLVHGDTCIDGHYNTTSVPGLNKQKLPGIHTDFNLILP